MGVPIVYRKAGEIKTQSFTFQETAEQRGIIAYDASTADTSGAILYTLESTVIEVGVGATQRRTDLTNADITFALTPFVKSQVLDGRANINFSWTIDNNVGSGIHRGQIQVTIYKDDAVIVAGAASIVAVAEAQTAAITTNLNLTIPRTSFKPDDQLKVKFAGWSTDAANLVHLHHDPKNRDFTDDVPNLTAASNTTRCRAFIPFVIL